jgi:hypothetical protein
MLQLLAIYFLCRKCSRLAEAKGYRGYVYGFLAGALTIGFELLSIIIGYFTLGRNISFYYIFVAYLGMGTGALISWFIAINLPYRSVEDSTLAAPPKNSPAPTMPAVTHISKEPIWCLQCGNKLPGGMLVCEKCGTKVPTLD